MMLTSSDKDTKSKSFNDSLFRLKFTELYPNIINRYSQINKTDIHAYSVNTYSVTWYNLEYLCNHRWGSCGVFSAEFRAKESEANGENSVRGGPQLSSVSLTIVKKYLLN